MKYDSINSSLFVNNRKKFTSHLKPGSVAIFNSNDLMPRSADGFFPFKQNMDLFYLSGIDQELTTLILFPDCSEEKYREVLFIRKTNQHIAVWEGHKYTKEEARKASGIQNIYWEDELESTLPLIMHLAEHCYLNGNEHGRYQSDCEYADLRIARKLKDQFPLHKFERSAPLMHHIRSIKSDIEVELIQHACNITASAFERVLRFVKPGVTEYEIQAEIQHEFLKRRATGPAYDSIIASGANACILHYTDNNQACAAGDLILMDFGAEYANYCSDMTRTIPVSGTFTERQRQVYQSVLKVMREATQMLRPGTLLDEYHKEVGKLMEKELLQLGLITASEVANQSESRPAYKKFFMHGTSHFLGLDVHDVGHKNDPIQAGMVFTCEPGIYIPEERIGIRLENDILVTDGDPVDLMREIPVEVEEIEEIMNSSEVVVA